MTAARNIWALFRRDLGAYFLSPVAWVIIFLFVLVNGSLFSYFAWFFRGNPYQITRIVESIFGFALFWILPLSPILTMRLIAEERRSGTIEMLMTAPVREWHVVVGKFLAAEVFYGLIWLSLLPFLVILEVLGKPDWGPVGATYIGLVTLGLLTNSLGVLASALSRNQLVSAVIALSGNLLFFFVYMVPSLFPEQAIEVSRVFQYFSFMSHFQLQYSQGIIDLRYLWFYVSFAAFFLFLSARVLEARKWR